MPEVHQRLDGRDVLSVLIRGVVAQDIHIHAGALFDQGKPDSSCADDSYGLACHFIAQKGKKWVPSSPALLADQFLARPEFARHCSHDKEGELGRCLNKEVGSVCKPNPITVGIRAVDVVEAHSNLRYNLQFAFTSFEYLCVDGIAQCCDQTIDAAAHFFQDRGLRRRVQLGKNFNLVSALTQPIECRFTDVTGCVDSEVHRYMLFRVHSRMRSSAFSMFSIELAILNRM